ncbi:MAG: RDD family protein [Bacteroidota bacterium]
MKKLLNRIPLKTIFWFYSITSLYSISWVYFFRPTQANYEHFISYLSSAFNIYNFNLYSAVYFLRDIRIISFDLYANSFLHIEAMFPLLILAASLIFFFSKFKDTRMLRYLLSIAIALMLMGFINGFVYRILVFDKLPLSSLLLFLFFRIIDVFIILCHYHVITRLNSEDELRHTSISEGDETLVLASRGQRFMNYFIDCFPRILVSLILASFMMSLARMSILSGNLDSSFEEYAFRYLLLFIGVIIVYFLLERLFLRSPAKFITNTQVIVKKGNHKTSSIVKRTLTRLIPVIDLFSFAFSEKGDGLHDEWSDTLVVL